jgi:hypothetical protein
MNHNKVWEFTDSEGKVHRGADWVVDMVKQVSLRTGEQAHCTGSLA